MKVENMTNKVPYLNYVSDMQYFYRYVEFGVKLKTKLRGLTLSSFSLKRKGRRYLDVFLVMARDFLIEILRNSEVQNKTHPFPITITKEHCSWICW